MAMLRSSSLVITIASCAALVGCAAQTGGASTAQSRSGGQCFIPSEVNSFTATKDGNVDVIVGVNRYFRLDLGGGCSNFINFATGVGIRATGGGSFVCEGYDAELIVPDPSGTQRCPVSGVRAITKEQYLADRKT
jgi:hypothetical protein